MRGNRHFPQEKSCLTVGTPKGTWQNQGRWGAGGVWPLKRVLGYTAEAGPCETGGSAGAIPLELPFPWDVGWCATLL